MKITILARLVTLLAITAVAELTAIGQQTNTLSDRFDNQVRDDFFSGDAARFRHAMKVCEDSLAKDPQYAPALAWKGSGDLTLAGQAFRSNDVPHGLKLWQLGLKEMDSAVALRPNSMQTLIPRAAVYLAIAKYDPNQQESRHLLELGVGDYEKTLRLQESRFDSRSRHARGELLLGLADGCYQLGEMEKCRVYLRRATNSCPNSVYSRIATSWLDAKDPTKFRAQTPKVTCFGCHSQ